MYTEKLERQGQTDPYLVVANTEENESLELIVEATSRDEAVELWRSWVHDFVGSVRNFIGSDEDEDEEDEPREPKHVYLIPSLSGTPRILGWGEEDGLKNVTEETP